jgi:MFS family permease
VSQGIAGVVQAFVADATTKENRDIVYGIYFTIGFTIASFSPVIMGYLADTLGFYASFTYVALVSLSAVVASHFLKWCMSRSSF